MDYEKTRQEFFEDFGGDADLDEVILWVEARFPKIGAANGLYGGLKAVEWVVVNMVGTVRCMSCRMEKKNGHAEDCLVGNAIAKAEAD